MKLHFNPGAPLNKKHCGSELTSLSEDPRAHTAARTHARMCGEVAVHTHTHTAAYLHVCDSHARTHTGAVSVRSVLTKGY